MCMERVLNCFDPPKVEEVLSFKVVLERGDLLYTAVARTLLPTNRWITEAKEVTLGNPPGTYRCGFHACEKEKDAETVAELMRKTALAYSANRWSVIVIPVLLREIVADGLQYDGLKVLVGRQIFCFKEVATAENLATYDWSEALCA